MSAAIRNLRENIRQRHRRAAAGPIGSPGVRIPRDQCAIALRGNAHARVKRGSRTRAHQLVVPFQHHLHGLARSLRELRAGHAPSIRGKLASETSAHYRSHNAHVAGRGLGASGELAADATHVLCGSPDGQVVALPLRHLAMRFEATVR